MKINFDEVLKQLDGKDFTEKEGEAEVRITVKLVCLRALVMPQEEDQKLTGEEAFKRYELARKINLGGEQEIEPAQAVLITNRAARIFSISISGQLYEKLRG